MRAIGWLATAFLLTTGTLLGSAAYVVSAYAPVERLLCAADDVAVMKWTCRQFIAHVDFAPAVIAELNQEAGAIYVAVIKDEQQADFAMRRLLTQGVQIDARDARTQSRMTALHSAVLSGEPHSVGLLLRHGARADAPDASGLTPVDYAHKMQAKYPDDHARTQVLQQLQVAVAALPAARPEGGSKVVAK